MNAIPKSRSQPGITFVIPAYNCSGTLRQAVASILEGNLGMQDEIIIVDDASTDETPKVIEDLTAAVPQIRALRHRYNHGSAAAGRNTAIEVARHDHIFCLDADNVLIPGSVPALAEYLVLCGADAAAFEELRYFLFDQQPDKTTHKWVFRPGVITLSDALSGSCWPGPTGNYLFTRQSWLRAGRYDEGVGGAIDSWAFGIRQLASGAKMVVQTNSGYAHRYGYASAFVRDSARESLSLQALRAMIPFLGLLEDRDVDYIMSRAGRGCWFDSLEQRPLKLKGMAQGHTGRVEYLTIAPPAPRQRATLCQRVRWRLRDLLPR